MTDLYISPEGQKNKNTTPLPIENPLPTVTPGTIELTKKEPHILTCFHENPEGVTFENQQDGEQVILFLRKHYTTNLSWELTSLFLIFIPLILLAVYPSLSLSFVVPMNYFIILGSFYYIIVLGYIFINYVIWFYNVGIVSNLRVVDIDVASINSKDVAAASLSDIVDVSYKQIGFKQNLFDYGDVFMETQATKANFEFLQVPHPGRITEIISQLMEKS